MNNQVQLITYPDSLGGNLQTLARVVQKHFSDLFKGGIHILPPFPSSGDRGFAPLTYLEIDPAFGDWADMQKLADHNPLIIDLMVNHISRQSAAFQDVLANGVQSKYADLFLTLDKIWADGKPVQADIDRMFLRRPKPYSTYETNDGESLSVWTTFGKTDPSEQIDLDVQSELASDLLRQYFQHFKDNGIRMVRLDAVGYVIKKLGTSCFFVEPDIYDFLDWIKNLADSLEIELLPEIHAHYSISWKLAERGFWIYDFILPYRILDTLLNRKSEDLLAYLRERPANQITMLDCHDGIPVKPDLDDRIDTQAAREVVDTCIARGANLSLIVSDEHKAPDGFDVHQIRCSYYAMLNHDDDAYLTARALQFFAPGIPQVYYVGLLAGSHDEERVALTGEGREINRHNYTEDEVDQAVEQEVVQRLMRLIRFRNDYEAFDGQFEVCDSDAQEIKLRWSKAQWQCELQVDLNHLRSVITYVDDAGVEQRYAL